MMIYLVLNENGNLVNMFPDYESADKYLWNHGVYGWTIESEEAC